MEITPRTKLVGLLGWPVAHSLSPLMHNSAFQALGLDYLYLNFEVKPDQLEEAVGGLRALNMAGANVTLPHKEKISKLLDEVSPEAELIGAVNTVKNSGGRLVGYNTDGRGFLESLTEVHGFNPQGKKVTIVGAGGAARAILTSLAPQGASRIALANRTRSRAKDLVQEFRDKFPEVEFRAFGLDDLSEGKYMADSDLFVNSTPVGLDDRVWLDIPLELLPASCIVYDVIYNPSKTHLLRQAEARGLVVANGLGMLLHQGAKSFKIWTGIEAPIEVMKEAVMRALEVEKG